jgi:methyltransferase (TIGR00027 family)
MKPGQASRTAEYTAFFRALESARPAQKRLFFDPFARYFIRPFLRNLMYLSMVPLLGAAAYWYVDRRLPGARTSAAACTRYIDEVWNRALWDGIRQIVILGAGFDCRPYRLPDSGSAAVFEVDHPMMLALKRERLRCAIPVMPQNVRFVETDLDKEGLPAALAGAGFDASAPALFLWEGVTNYLNYDTVDSVLRYIGTLAPGSNLVFTYVHAGALDGSRGFDGAGSFLRKLAQMGEPWIFGLYPSQIPDFLRKRGLELDHDQGAGEYRAHYFGPESKQMKGYEFYHVAIAHVPQRRG